MLFVGVRYMKYRDMKHWDAEGSIITAIHQNEIVFIAGEYSKWYPESLGLEKLYRNILLLKEELLIVCDVVIRKPHSSSTKMSAFFHNR